mgnify:CR=1 FL=1
MAIEKLRPALSLDDERLRALGQVVPEAFADGQINWEVLRELLGERVEDEKAGAEHFGLFWPGKREARRLAAQPSKGTLVPAPGEGVDEETTGNIFIEGDNLEVLKLLKKSYSGRIKMIYIDPPYNTGNDLIYKDNFSEPLGDYLKKTGQMGEAGELLTTNTKADGRFHTNWLNMIYPRLRLARDLLREDGVIFISIDDNELDNLTHVVTEVFGEENFVATIVWQKVFAKKNKAQISGSHDYILVYTKSLGEWHRNLLPRSEEQLEAFKNVDNDPRGVWQSVAFSVQSEDAEKRQAYRYKIKLPSGREVLPPTGRHWGRLPDGYEEMLCENRIWFGQEGDSPPRVKVFLNEVQQGIVPDTWWTHEESGNNQEAKKEVLELLPNMEPFGTPKPTRLIMRMLEIAVSKDEGDIILDFFAGSGPTAHAVMKMNKQDGGNRRFMCVQLPEPLKKNSKEFQSGYKTIADLTKERIRRAATTIKKDTSKELKLRGELDFGFKVFKLAQSTFQAWQDYDGDDIRQLEHLFALNETPFVEGWKQEEVLTELLLIEGFPLNSKITPAETFTANRVIQVESEFSAHRLFICLEPRLNDHSIERVAELPGEDIFICLDSALTDTAKMRLMDVGNVRTI